MNSLLVITPTLGGSPHLGATVASVAALGDMAHHLVVGPPDAEESVRSLRSHAHVLIEHERRGLYPAINQAVQEVAGDNIEWITWINDDDLLAADGVRGLLHVVKSSGADVGYGKVRLIDAHGEHIGWVPVAHEPRDLLELLACGTMPLAQPGTIIRRSVFERLGGLDERLRFAADLEFFVRALRAGSQFDFFDCEVAAFRIHAGQLSKQEHEAGAEAARVFGSPDLIKVARRRAARWRFRAANLTVYVDRIRRFGWRRMREIYRHV